jgi:hypothetical protein
MMTCPGKEDEQAYEQKTNQQKLCELTLEDAGMLLGPYLLCFLQRTRATWQG